MNTLHSEWQFFRKKAIPTNLTDVQLKYLKLAFYSGSASVLRVQELCFSKKLPVEVAMEIMTTLDDERYEFFGQFTEDNCSINCVEI